MTAEQGDSSSMSHQDSKKKKRKKDFLPPNQSWGTSWGAAEEGKWGDLLETGAHLKVT